jgi:LysM repeat protein
MADALYIGSLVMENIKPQLKGEASIELIITSSRNGDITADAVDLDSDLKENRQSLSVSLRSLDEDTLDAEIPDYELESNDTISNGLYERASDIEAQEEEKRKFPWFLVACGALVLTAIALIIWLFFFQGGGNPLASATRTRQIAQGQQNERPVVAAQPTQPATPPPAAAQPAQPVTPPTVIQAPAQAPVVIVPPAGRERTAPPVASFAVPAVIPREGVPYNIRYGDTLWDIAEAFYRNPWLYPHIARFNNIRNPDFILAGTTIRVPPRN